MVNWQRLSSVGYIHRVSKNVPPMTCYNLDIHDPITIIFGRSVTEKVRNHTMLCFPPHLSSASTLPAENPECSALVHCACNTVQLLQRYRLPFHLNHAPNSLCSWTHWLQDLGVIQQHEYESWMKKIEEIKQLVEFTQCINTAFEGKLHFCVSPFYQVVPKHKLFAVA